MDAGSYHVPGCEVADTVNSVVSDSHLVGLRHCWVEGEHFTCASPQADTAAERTIDGLEKDTHPGRCQAANAV